MPIKSGDIHARPPQRCPHTIKYGVAGGAEALGRLPRSARAQKNIDAIHYRIEAGLRSSDDGMGRVILLPCAGEAGFGPRDKTIADPIAIKCELIGCGIGGLEIDNNRLNLSQPREQLRQGNFSDPATGAGSQPGGGFQGSPDILGGGRPFVGAA